MPKILHESLYHISEVHLEAWKTVTEGPDICLTTVKLFSSRTIPTKCFYIEAYKFGCSLKNSKGLVLFVRFLSFKKYDLGSYLRE